MLIIPVAGPAREPTDKPGIFVFLHKRIEDARWYALTVGANIMRKYFETLGLPDDASWREIRGRYRVLSLLNHPDHGGDSQRFIEIQQAYEALRKEYEQPQAVAAYVEPPIPRKHRTWQLHKAWRRLVRVAALVGIVLSVSRLDPVLIGPKDPQNRPQVDYVRSTCPTGQPVIMVDSVSSQETGYGQAAYTISGRIQNTTSADIMVEQLGFYVGDYSAFRPPDWLADPYQMTTSGNFSDIGVGRVVSFTETGGATKSAGSAKVSIVAAFPRDFGMPVEHTWSWVAADPSCQPD